MNLIRNGGMLTAQKNKCRIPPRKQETARPHDVMVKIEQIADSPHTNTPDPVNTGNRNGDEEPATSNRNELTRCNKCQTAKETTAQEKAKMEEMRMENNALKLAVAEIRHEYAQLALQHAREVNETYRHTLETQHSNQNAPIHIPPNDSDDDDDDEMVIQDAPPPQAQQEEQMPQNDLPNNHLEFAPPGREAPEQRTCCICLVEPACVIVVGCGSVCMCGTCARRWQQLNKTTCPHCGRVFQDENGLIALQVVF
jgi:Zinc finger, C3HC4 type (RING finger)